MNADDRPDGQRATDRRASDRRERETAEAARWWLRLGSRPPHEVSREEREEFNRWLRESPLHVAEFLHIARVHEALERFKLWSEIEVETPHASESTVALLPVPSRAKVRERSSWIPKPALAMAAAAAAIVVAAAFMFAHWRGETIATAVAERREVMLSDGSVVRLEPESTLQVRFARSERHVTLQQGRALFRVAKDAQRPFLVESADTLVRAVGTEFGVERGSRGVVITVAEGKVAVRPADSIAHDLARPVARMPATAIVVGAGQQLAVRNSGIAEPVQEVDIVRALAWSEGRLVFDSAPLGEVLAEFNRYNHVQLRVDDVDLARRAVSGVFLASDPDTLIAFIRTGARVNVIREGERQILITPSGRNLVD